LNNKITPELNQYFKNMEILSRQQSLAIQAAATASITIPDISKVIAPVIKAAIPMQQQLANNLSSFYKSAELTNSIQLQISNAALIASSIPDVYKNLSIKDFRLSVKLEDSLKTFSNLSTESINKINDTFYDVQQSDSDFSVKSKSKYKNTNNSQETVDPVQIKKEFETIEYRLKKVESQSKNNNFNDTVSKEQSNESNKNTSIFESPIIIKLLFLINFLLTIDAGYNAIKDLIEIFNNIVNAMN